MPLAPTAVTGRTAPSCAPRAHAISGDAAFLERLRRGSFRAEVHSVFAHSVNLRDVTDGRLHTLAAAGSDDAPSTLVVDAGSFERFALRRGAPVVAGDRALRAGDLVIGLDGARPWSATLPGWPRSGVRPDWLERFVDRHGVPGGIKPRLRPANALEAETARRLGRATAALHAALHKRDMDAVHGSASRLVGLGPGLTPAGDDHLVGLATALALLGPRARDERDVLARVVDEHAERTNIISHAALAHAVHGRVRQSLVDLVTALVERDRRTVAFRADRVLAIGATSGTDILTGLLAGLTSATREEQPCR